MNTYRYRILYFLMITGIVFCGGLTIQAQNSFDPLSASPEPMSAPPGMPPAKTQQFQEEMAEFQKEFESLSPKEQDEFFKSMDDAVKKIDELSKTPEGKELLSKLEKGTISDEELDKLINQLVEEEAPKKEKVEAKKEEKEPELPKQILTTKHEKAIDAINSLIAHTNAFIVKAATIPELPSKIKHWVRKKNITLKSGQTWNSLKTDIERLVEQLSRLLERDPKTKEYYHIDELLKNETLLNNLLKVQKNIAKMEPLAEEMPLLEVKKMKKDSKKAYQTILNEYHEALYILSITDAIKKLFELFDPIAKKYREAEEKAVKEAERLGKPSAGLMRPISMPTTGPEYSPPPRYTPPSSYQPSAYIPSENGYFDAPREPIRKPATPKRPADGVPKKKESKGKEGEEDKIESGIMRANGRLQREINDALSKIEDQLKSAVQIIKDNNLIKHLDSSFIDNSPINISLAIEVLPEFDKTLNIQKGLLGDLHQLHRKFKSASMRTSLQKKLSDIYNKKKKDLTGFYDKLDVLQKNWDSKQGTVPADKKYAYFGMRGIEIPVPDEPTEEQLLAINEQKKRLEQARSKVLAPYSLFEIKDLLKKIKATIDNFSKEKLAEEKKK